MTRSSFDLHILLNLLSLAWVASLSICTSYLSTPISFEVIKRIKFRPAMLLGASLSGLGKKIQLASISWTHSLDSPVSRLPLMKVLISFCVHVESLSLGTIRKVRTLYGVGRGSKQKRRSIVFMTLFIYDGGST